MSSIQNLLDRALKVVTIDELYQKAKTVSLIVIIVLSLILIWLVVFTIFTYIKVGELQGKMSDIHTLVLR